ncbi:TonB-dependent receptor [Dinghuibacter silviterrae]|nr:TonB-dependent receptor [Dinghuibacter silviterrae]
MKATQTAIILLSGLLASMPGLAQQKHTVYGTVKDKASGEVLIGASVSLLERPAAGTVSNGYGFYSLTAPTGLYHLVVSFTGHTADTISLTLDREVAQDVSLGAGQELQEVVIDASKNNRNLTQSLMGVQKMSAADIKSIPALFGEQDVLKAIQLLPGIESAGDGNSGFFVRGGGPDQNLILLDEATVYNPTHLLGFFSTFNTDAIKDVTVYKGGMPAQYGGRLSSVEDIKTNDGNDQKYIVSAGIGLIDSHANLEGPIVKGKGSFDISARRTYADLFLRLSRDSTRRNDQLYFYDINAKADYSFGGKDKIFFSGYLGQDVLGINNQFSLNYGNATATLRWNHVFSDRLFANTSLIYSRYNFDAGINTNNNDLTTATRIKDIHFKEDLQYFAGSAGKIYFGLESIHHTLSPGIFNTSSTSSFNSFNLPNKYSLESALYVAHEWSPAKRWNINYGIRLSMFNVLGPGTFYTYNAAGETVDSSVFSSGRVVKTFVNPEPRVSGSFQINDVSSIKASYDRNVQNLHLLNNSTSTNPTDLWIPSSNNVQPEIADQVSIGYYRNFHHNAYEFSVEGYYKYLQHQIDYKDGSQLVANVNIESELLYGNGRDYGLEFYLKKKTGKLTGWISYTLSKSELKIPGVNNDTYYPSRQDEPQNISVVGVYSLSKRWTLSATWVYNTGYPVSWPSGKYDVNGQPVYLYQQRNDYRMPDYHRLDLGATVIVKKTAKWESSWTFSVYNAYDRQNAYTIVFQQNPNNLSQTQAVQTTLFGIIPSVTYNFKF